MTMCFILAITGKGINILLKKNYFKTEHKSQYNNCNISPPLQNYSEVLIKIGEGMVKIFRFYIELSISHEFDNFQSEIVQVDSGFIVSFS